VWLPHQPGEDEIAWAREFYSAIQPHQVGAYVNFLDRDDAERVPAAYGEGTYRRLVALKDRHDPDNLFRLNHNIRPSTIGPATGATKPAGTRG
jgi:FAD/FMN-containing dehydrogenase